MRLFSTTKVSYDVPTSVTRQNGFDLVQSQYQTTSHAGHVGNESAKIPVDEACESAGQPLGADAVHRHLSAPAINVSAPHFDTNTVHTRANGVHHSSAHRNAASHLMGTPSQRERATLLRCSASIATQALQQGRMRKRDADLARRKCVFVLRLPAAHPRSAKAIAQEKRISRQSVSLPQPLPPTRRCRANLSTCPSPRQSRADRGASFGIRFEKGWEERRACVWVHAECRFRLELPRDAADLIHLL